MDGAEFVAMANWRMALPARSRAFVQALARLGLLLLLLVLVFMALPQSAHSAQLDLIEARQADNGRTVYTNAEPAAVLPAGAISAAATASARTQRTVSGPRPGTVEIDTAIREAAERHGVDANLVRAVVKVESNYDPRAVSRKGAMGLMQLMPATARRLNVTNPFDLRQNLDAGVRHLKDLLANYNGNVRLSLAAYNAGAMAVARANGVPGIAETQSYIRQITDLYRTHSATDSGGWLQASSIHAFRDGKGTLTFTSD